MTYRPIFLLTLVLSCLLAPAEAQDPLGQKPSTGNRRKGKLELELPTGPEKQKTTAPATPAELVSALLQDLAEYPGGSSLRAIDQLVLSGEAVKEPLRLVLDGIQFPPRMAAAVALSRLKDDQALDGLERLLLDPRAKKWVGQILSLIGAVDARRAETLASLHAGKGEPALRVASFRYLSQHLRPELVEDLRPLLESKQAAVRRQVFSLLSRVEGGDLVEDCLKLLGDDDAPLAADVSAYLAERLDERATATLLEWSEKDPPTRRSLWALLTVAEFEERHSVQLLSAERIPDLTRRLRALDPMERVTSAIALAQIGFRSDSPGIEALLGEQVLPTLMETFLQNIYFKDYMALFSLASVRVRHITGVDLGEDLTRWRAAWQGEGETPLIRRDLPPDRLASLAGQLSIRFERRGFLRDGGREQVLLAGDGLLKSMAKGNSQLAGALFVGEQQMKELVEKLLASDVLSRGRRRVDESDDSAVYRRLRLVWQNRERTVVLGAQEDEAFDLAVAAIMETADAAYWQRLYVGAPANFPEFYYQQAPHFGPDSGDLVRRRRLLQAVQIGLPMLDELSRTEALTVLWRAGVDRDLLGPEEFRLLQHALRDEQLPEGSGSILVRMLVDIGDPALFSPFAEFVVGQFGEAGEPLLKRALRGLDLISAGLEDSRPLVRIAALREGAEGGGLEKEALFRTLDDPDARVRREAIMAMGRLHDPECRSKLFEMAQGESEALRRIALEALGFDRSQETQDLLAAAVETGEESDVLAAYRGLGKIGNKGAVEILSHSVKRFGVRTQTGLSALDTLAAIESPAALEALRDLLGSEEAELREEAAYRLAACGKMAAVPELLAVLEVPDRAARSRDSLSLLFCCEGGENGETFVQRFRDEPDLEQRDWFQRALNVQVTSAEADLVEGVPLPILVRSLRDQNWFVRHNSIACLEREFGVHFGTPYRFENRADVARIAERWERYFALPKDLR
ncbi:MAG: HEAT repeat domain-containing protein [Planctomycetota bacterium]